MTTALGIWNQVAANGQTKGSTPTINATNEGGSDSSSAATSAGITANDFLTLLVTELKNQDPTANTDPNQYINQLVQINSLQQLIAINETLTADSHSATPTPHSRPAVSDIVTPVADLTHKSTSIATHGSLAVGGTGESSAVSSPTSTAIRASNAVRIRPAPGNLSIPETNPAAQRVASSLLGRARVR